MSNVLSEEELERKAEAAIAVYFQNEYGESQRHIPWHSLPEPVKELWCKIVKAAHEA